MTRSPAGRLAGTVSDGPSNSSKFRRRKLRVTGTPTLIFANGKRVPGGVPGPQLIKRVDENSKPS